MRSTTLTPDRIAKLKARTVVYARGCRGDVICFESTVPQAECKMGGGIVIR